jgi:single-stranded DNA-binding protein
MENKVSKATGANISLTGYIGSLTVKEKSEGKVTVFMRLATHRRIYTNNSKEEKTDWHNAVAYGNIAKILKDHAKKGDSIIINGELENWEFTEDNDKSTEKTYIKINRMQFKSDCYSTLIGFIGSVYRENEDSPLYVKLSNIRKTKNAEGDLEDKTDWHTVIFYGKLSEVIEEHAKKGQKISVHGCLEVIEEEKEGSEYKIEKNYIRAYNAKFL